MSEYVLNLIRDQVEARTGTVAVSHPAHELPAEEWAHRFKEWAESPAHADLPVLPDEAMSRDFIYAERGL